MSRLSKLHFLYRSALIAALAAALACASGDDTAARPEQADNPAPASVTPPTHQELANSTFSGIVEVPVQLVDGTWEGEPFVEDGASRPAVGLVEDFLLLGDLTGDGHDDSVALLWTSSGGSGTFDYIAAAGRDGQGVSILGSAALGDRVKVRAGQILDGQIELEVVQAGPEDAACCPSELATRIWTLGPEGLIEGEAEITGTLSIASLEGPEWLLVRFSRDEEAPAEPEVTLVFEDGRIAGGSGCNRYFADVEGSSDMAGSISIGPAGGTRMMCPEEVMAVEGRFLEQLSAANSYSFLAGKLVLNWEDGDNYGVMIFTQRQP